MKVFISHSSSDKPLVDTVRALIIASFVETVEVSYSSASVSDGGIAAGQDWLEWIRAQVQDSAMTIVLVTPLSKTKPWLMWEAGAVSGVGFERRATLPVVPLLFSTRADEVPSPLVARQIKSGSAAADMRDLLESICRIGKLTYRSPDEVRAAMDTYMKAVASVRIPGMHDVFISCPMTSVPGPEYEKLMHTIQTLTAAITGRGWSVYSAAGRIGKDVDPEAIAAETDLAALIASRNFLMIYPSRLLSSCLLEAGYALVAGTPSVYFVRSDDDLPYLLRGAVESFRNARRVRYRDESEIVQFFERYPEKVVT